jgi:hypothetical protein
VGFADCASPPVGFGLYSKDAVASHLSRESSGIRTPFMGVAPQIQACVDFECKSRERFAFELTVGRRGTAYCALDSLDRCGEVMKSLPVRMNSFLPFARRTRPSRFDCAQHVAAKPPPVLCESAPLRYRWINAGLP